jgi:hydroxypyruvate isomerase
MPNNLNFCANISMLFSELPLRDRFAAAKKAGFNAVEIQFPYEIDVTELAQLQTQNDLKIILINVSADDLLQGGEGLAAVPTKQTQFDSALENCLEYAQQLKVSCVNVLPGGCFDDALQNNYLSTFKKNLKKAADALQNINVKCTFEAINTIDMPHFLISSPVQMMGIINDLKHSNLFMQYDIYHMTKMGRDVCADIQQYHPHIGHIQFADCPGRHEPNTGDINFTAVFESINKCGYNGWVGAEYKPSKNTDATLTWYKTNT